MKMEIFYLDFLFGFFIAIGVGTGIFWAKKVKKEHGTTYFTSRTDASEDIDKIFENNKK